MKKLALALVAATAAFVGQATAADMPMKAARPVAAPIQVANWTGCYIGGGGGYGMWNQEHTEYLLTGVADSLTATSGGRGWFGTVQGGCDYQFGGPGGQWLIGGFADYDFADIHGTRNASIGTFPYRGDEKLDEAWSVGGRIGWLPSPNFLTFFSGGYTQAHFNSYNLALNIAPGFPPAFTVPGRWRDGWFVGGGYEYQLSFLPGLTWKTEYRFADYDTERDTVYLFNTNTPSRFTDTHKYVQTIRSTLQWRFNFGGPAVVAKY